MPFVVTPYDDAWPALFAAERERLEKALRPWVSGGIRHVGSTAVPGMPAKPVIDMIAGVRDLTGARAARGPLAELGYVHRPHRADALWFARPPTEDPFEHTHHLHLTEVGSPLWRERLAFRDLLRADGQLRAEYRELKQQLAEAAGAAGYTAADKRAFVLRVLARAGVTMAP